MYTDIYYFTGTGNSLAAARDLAKRLSASLTPIPSAIERERVNTEAERIGVVFPVYHQGVPSIVRRFIQKIDNIDKKYVFAVCTYGDSPGISMEYLDGIIRTEGGRLAAGFSVHMPYNFITPSVTLKDFFRSFILRGIPEEKRNKLFADWEIQVAEICRSIEQGKAGILETKANTIEHLVDTLNLRETLQKNAWLKIAGFKGHTDLPFRESLQVMDFGFSCDDRCNRCGVCSKVCPVGNIETTEGRPVWRHHCELCFACLQWCPKESIQFSKRTRQGQRYHHPDITLSDMLEHAARKS